MGHFTAERLAPLSGIGFALLLIITRVLVFTYPDSDAPTSEAVSFSASKDDKLIAVSIVGSFAALFFVWFGGSVREVIRAAEGGTGRLAALSFGGAVITAGVILVEEFLVFAAAESAGGVTRSGHPDHLWLYRPTSSFQSSLVLRCSSSRQALGCCERARSVAGSGGRPSSSPCYGFSPIQLCHS